VTDPDALEARAEQLRACARSARVKAGALATHLDSLEKSAKDDTLWRGPYPTTAAGTLAGYRALLRGAADLLNEDAEAWQARAGRLDRDADAARKELAKQQAEEARREPEPSPGPR